VPIGIYRDARGVWNAYRVAWISALAGVAAVAVAFADRRRRGWVAAAAAGASIVVTWLSAPRPATDGWDTPATLAIVELLALLGLIVLVVRLAPVRQAVVAGLAAGAAVAVLVLRFASPATALEAVGMCGLWALGAVIAAAGGLYVRWLDVRRRRAVADARQAQRLEIAHDLHDFVAHHVSEMVAQAQAAQVAADSEPAYTRSALHDIEQAGLSALAALDQGIHVLRDGTSSQRQPGLAELAELSRRFAGAQVNLDLSPGLVDRVPPDLAAVAYRIVVEALTNVRRHAPTATVVDVIVSGGDDLELVVSDNGGPAADPVAGRKSGLGLRGLAERVEALGGTFIAGPGPGPGQRGWSIHARLPMAAKESA
jgi:signal transduction histidine kinase